jgi:hypothetical protein
MSRRLGWREAPLSFGRPGTEAPGRTDFEASTLRPIPTLESVGKSPLRFGPSYTVSPTPHRTARGTEMPPLHAPSEVRFPYSVLPVARSHLAPAGSQPTGSVAPSGFLTLSAPCSPHDLPGLFHPGSAPGVTLRGLSLRVAVRSLERRTPRVFADAPSSTNSPSGIEHTAQILHVGLGFSQVAAPLPPWDCPPRGFLRTPA